MKTMMRGTVYLIILALAISVVSLMRPAVANAPRGIILPLEKPLATIPVNQVKFYEALPKDSQLLARINIEQHFGKATPLIERDILTYARELAAKVGANGILVKQFGRTSGDINILSTYIFHAIAFRVKPS